MLSVSANNLKNLKTNWLSLSEVIWFGTLYLEKISQMNNSTKPTVSIVLLVGMKVACFVSLLMTTRILVKPLDSGSWLMKSINMDFYSCGKTGSCLSSPYGLCLLALFLLQVLQD